MGRRGRTTSGLLGALVLLGVGLTGCGDGSDGTGAISVRTVARTTEAAGSARTAGTIETRGPSGVILVSRMEGEIDFAGGRVATRTHTAGPGGKETVTEQRAIGRAHFSNDPQMRRSFGDADKLWVRVDLPEEMSAAPVADAVDVVADLTSRATSVEELGPDTVRGGATTHYRLHRPDDRPDEVRDTIARSVAEIWVDDAGRLRRLQEEAVDGSFRYVFELFDFGVPVHVEEPPAEDVAVQHYDSTTTIETPDFTPEDMRAMRRPRSGADWEAIANGDARGLGWRVLAIRTETGACFVVETTPPGADALALSTTGPTAPPGSDEPPWLGSLEVAGRMPGMCLGAASLDSLSPVLLQADELANGARVIFGTVAPEVASVELHHADGRTKRVAPTHSTTAFALDAGDELAWLVPDTGTGDWRCRVEPDGSVNTCDGSAYGDRVPAAAPPG